MDEVLTAQECADLLKLNIKTVYNLFTETREPGKIFARKVGREWRVTRDEIMRYLRGDTAEAEQSSQQALEKM
jgi:excisionase family DNA binding protein